MQKLKIRTLRFGFGENLDLRIIHFPAGRSLKYNNNKEKLKSSTNNKPHVG